MFSYTFMQHAFIAGGLIALICGLMSYFVVARKTAFASHALGHISLTGASGAVLLGLSAITGQLIVNLIAGIFMGLLGDKIKKNDISVGIVLTFFLGLGTYFLFLYQTGYSGSIMAILVGNILTVSMSQIILLIILSFITLGLMAVIARPLFISSLDPAFATSKNISIRLVSVLFFIGLAITVSMACQIVGILLVFSLLIGPGVIAGHWADGFYKSIGLSMLISLITVWLSIVIAFYSDMPVSFCITMLITLLYVIGLIKNAIIR